MVLQKVPLSALIQLFLLGTIHLVFLASVLPAKWK